MICCQGDKNPYGDARDWKGGMPVPEKKKTEVGNDFVPTATVPAEQAASQQAPVGVGLHTTEAVRIRSSSHRN